MMVFFAVAMTLLISRLVTPHFQIMIIAALFVSDTVTARYTTSTAGEIVKGRKALVRETGNPG